MTIRFLISLVAGKSRTESVMRLIIWNLELCAPSHSRFAFFFFHFHILLFQVWVQFRSLSSLSCPWGSHVPTDNPHFHFTTLALVHNRLSSLLSLSTVLPLTSLTIAQLH